MEKKWGGGQGGRRVRVRKYVHGCVLFRVVRVGLTEKLAQADT